MKKTEFITTPTPITAWVITALSWLFCISPAWSGSYFKYQGVDAERISLTALGIHGDYLRMDFSDGAGFLVFNAQSDSLRLFDTGKQTYQLIGPSDMRYLRQAASALNSDLGRTADAVMGAFLGKSSESGSAASIRRQLAETLNLPTEDMAFSLQPAQGETVARQGHICRLHTLQVNHTPAYTACLAQPLDLGLGSQEILTLQRFVSWSQELAELWTELGLSVLTVNGLQARIPVSLQRISSDEAAVPTQLQTITETLSQDPFLVPEGYQQKRLPWQT